MGGGAEVIYLNWCWGGGGGGQVFWVDRIAPSKKIKTSTIWKDFCDKRLPQKIRHGKNGMAPSYVERKDCPHKKYPHRGNSPPPPDGFFLFMLPPPAERLYPPFACADHDL